jgi:hypothetical protein
VVTAGPSAPAPESDGLDEVRQILREINVQPSPLTRGDGTNVRAEDMPRFSPKVLALYPRDSNGNEFRDAVIRARDLLSSQIAALPLKDQISGEVEKPKLKQDVLEHQKDVARAIRTLTEGFELLKEADSKRAKEPSKRWQAHYDYMLARMQMQIAFLFEYQTALGRVRRDDLPDLPSYHNSWKLVLSEKETGDREGKKYSKSGRQVLEKVIKDYPDSPWAELASRTLKLPSGLEWQGFQAK